MNIKQKVSIALVILWLCVCTLMMAALIDTNSPSIYLFRSFLAAVMPSLFLLWATDSLGAIAVWWKQQVRK